MTSALKLAVVGSRSFSGLHWIQIHLAGFKETFDKEYDRLVIVSGGGRGPDTEAEILSRELGLDLVVYRAQWDKYGPSAGPRRNALIVAECDRMVAFWDGESRGTLDAMRKAKAAGKGVYVFREDGAQCDWNES